MERYTAVTNISSRQLAKEMTNTGTPQLIDLQFKGLALQQEMTLNHLIFC